MRPTRRRVLGLLGLASVTLAGCLGDDDDDDTDDDTPTPPVSTPTPSASPTITLEAGAFDPLWLAVDPGDTVTFEHAAGEHTVTTFHEANDVAHRVPEGAAPVDEPLEEGTLEVTVEQAGVHGVFCRPHAPGGMATAIVVGSPSADEPGMADPPADVSDPMADTLSTIVADIAAAYDLDVDTTTPPDDDNDDPPDPGY